jgi:hypothetical protein
MLIAQVERMKRGARTLPVSLILSLAKVDSAFYESLGAMDLRIARTVQMKRIAQRCVISVR